MARRSLKITLAYDGTNYCGWQLQRQENSIQAAVESAWRSVSRESRRVIASGRTDAGVHAYGQVVGLETKSSLQPATLMRALNANLPADIRVRDVEEARPGFHPIRDAISKCYRYCIQPGGVPDVMRRRYCWYVPRQLNVASMQQAATSLVGQHDFRAFQASGSPRKTTVRNVFRVDLHSDCSEVAEFIEIEFEADGFLYNMVRNMVGTLVAVGQGRQDVDWPAQVLQSLDRRRAGVTAPAHGLTLLHVSY